MMGYNGNGKSLFMATIEERINYWCDTLENKAQIQTYGGLNTYFHFSRGKSYYKIVMTYQDTKQDTVHAFVNQKTGDIYKPASWSAPYKDVRYNLWTEYEKLLKECDWAGKYLYKR